MKFERARWFIRNIEPHCERMECYFTVASSDSSSFYGDRNKGWNYKVKLYKPLTLKGKWEVGLLSCRIDTDNDLPALQLVQSPLCASLMVVGGKSHLPVLKHLLQSGDGATIWNFDPPSYIPVTQNFIETVEIYITDIDGFRPSFTEGTSTCVLHLRKSEQD
jgi:hypothetical protein